VVSVCRGLVIILACTVSVSRLLQGALAYATYARAYVASNAAEESCAERLSLLSATRSRSMRSVC